MDKLRIILASGSPRRKELLSNMGIKFEVIVSQEEEDMTQNFTYRTLAKHLARQKAESVFKNITGDCVVIGSDTMVVYDGKKLGKPKDEKEARGMLDLISGNQHKVATGLCVFIRRNGEIKNYNICSVTSVYVSKLSPEDIDWYIFTNEWCDKAGSYAIQGYFSKFIEKINGDYNTVVGLPCNEIYKIFRKENIL